MAWRIWRRWAGLWFVVVGQEVLHPGAPVSGPVEHLEQHGVGDLEAGSQRLGLGRHKTVESALVPVDKTLGRFGFYDFAPFGGVVSGAGKRPVVLADVLGCLDDDAAGAVVAGAPGAPGHLVELPGRQNAARSCRRISTKR